MCEWSSGGVVENFGSDSGRSKRGKGPDDEVPYMPH